MEERHNLKIEINTLKVGLIVVEELSGLNDENSVIENISSTSSIQAFPTSSLILNATPKYPNLIAMKSGDSLSLSFSKDNTDYESLFVGFILSMKIKTQKEKVKLEVECVSEFYKLQDKSLNKTDFKFTSGLREIINQIISLCDIKGTVVIEENISNEYELSHFRNFPSLSLINSICLELDLVYDFTKGDVMKISKRKDVLHKMFNSKPIELGKDKIISSEFEQ
jgi:hypothetical protein